MIISGNIIDVIQERIFKGTVEVENGKIIAITADSTIKSDIYIMPGFVDAHVHIESSMLIPSEFARIAVVHGTVSTVSDPHEIANVLGVKGVEFMIANGKRIPFKFYFGAPSCVPATSFETSGASIDAEEIEELMKFSDVKFLGEMMNFPGVLFGDADVLKKLEIARKYNKPIDGHAPGLKNQDLVNYYNAGISTDHECFTIAEAEEKIRLGMKILIREGSAAKNFDELAPLLSKYPDKVMLCSDDKHPDDLVHGHMNLLLKRAMAKGVSLMHIIRALTVIPVNHYKLDVGLLQVGDAADFILVDNLTDFNIKSTYINGILVADDGKSLIKPFQEIPVNNFNAKTIELSDIAVVSKSKHIRVIDVLEGQLITKQLIEKPLVSDGLIVSDTSRDILKMVVLNRYQPEKPAVAFIHGFGFTHGAIASSVSHDSHNIIAVGCTDEDICLAINCIIEAKGGVSVSDNQTCQILALPFAGLMSGEDGYATAERYESLDLKAKQLGCTLQAPFMTLSFMALLVIPELKLSDKGLFDGSKFAFVDLHVD